MKRLFLLLNGLIFISAAQAQAYVPYETWQSAQQAATQFPILQCPASNEVMKDLRDKLRDLKDSIKKTANCKPMLDDATALGQLVTTDRENFVKLITQGQSQGLSASDLKAVNDYTSKLTDTTASLIAVFSGKDACFAEDKKGQSLSFITSLIGEGSKILSLIGGPVGGTVSVAANLITGFLDGVIKIKEKTPGYKFDKAEQQLAYADTLCSFFDYRREVDTLLNNYDSVANLRNLGFVIQDQLNILASSCPECKTMIDLVDAEITAGKNTSDLLWTQTFEKDLIVQAEAVDQLYTRKLGSHTYRTLKTRSWIPVRISALQNNQLKADLGVQDVLTQMIDVQNFLIKDQANRFMARKIYEANKWRDLVLDQINKGYDLVWDLKLTVNPPTDLQLYPTSFNQYHGYGRDIHAFYTPEERYKFAGMVMESLDSNLVTLKKADKAKVNTFFREMDDLTRGLKVSVDILDNYCTFLSLADWYNTEPTYVLFDDAPSVSQTCESTKFAELKRDVAQFTSISPNFVARSSVSPLPAQVAPIEVSAAEDLTEAERRKYIPNVTTDRMTGLSQATTAEAKADDITLDWVEAFTNTLKNMSQDPTYIQRQ